MTDDRVDGSHGGQGSDGVKGNSAGQDPAVPAEPAEGAANLNDPGPDDLDAWMAAHFPPPQLSGDDEVEAAVSARPMGTVGTGSTTGAGAWPVVPGAEAVAGVEPGDEVDPVAGTAAGAGVAGEGPKEPSLDGSSALDDLFGESKFVDYNQPIATPSIQSPIAPPPTSQPPTSATVALGASASDQPTTVLPATGGQTPGQVDAKRSRSGGISRTQTVMMWVAGSLVAVLALVALFLVGTRVPDLLGPAPAVLASATPTPTPTPTPTEKPVGPVAAGEYHWAELLGGECLEPYTGPWADNFTVVDCGGGHAAQLVARGSFDTGDDESALYPGIDALQGQINLLCTAPTVINYSAAGKFDDIQFEASFAATPQEWAEGQHDYFCFVSRSSGGPITGTVAVPPPAAPSPSPSP